MSIIKERPAEHGALGYTDFTAIYISEALPQEEQEFVRIHELSHIWLGHNLRGQAFKASRKNTDHLLLNIAMDFEIAKHIYTAQDDAVIQRPLSRLNGVISRTDPEKYPNCQYFEEYYQALEKDGKRAALQFLSHDATYNQFKKQQGGEGEKLQSQSVVVENAKKNAKKRRVQSSIQKHQALLGAYKLKPSLASEIDAVAGRQRVVRVKSYRRPSRRSSDFFTKGEISKRKTPRIMVYVDRSGSFDPSKTKQATDTLATILKKYRGAILHDVLFFNDELLEQDPRKGDGGTNHQVVIADIQKTNAHLSIVLTDEDDGLDTIPESLPKTIVIPIGCTTTRLARKLGVVEVSL